MLSRYNIAISYKKQIFAFLTTVDKLTERSPSLFISALTAQKLRAYRYMLNIFLNPVEWMLTEPGEKSRIGSIYNVMHLNKST
jgi:hypothetical protein